MISGEDRGAPGNSTQVVYDECRGLPHGLQRVGYLWGDHRV